MPIFVNPESRIFSLCPSDAIHPSNTPCDEEYPFAIFSPIEPGLDEKAVLHKFPSGRVCDHLTTISGALIVADVTSAELHESADNPSASRAAFTSARTSSAFPLLNEPLKSPMLILVVVVGSEVAVVGAAVDVVAGELFVVAEVDVVGFVVVAAVEEDTDVNASEDICAVGAVEDSASAGSVGSLGTTGEESNSVTLPDDDGSAKSGGFSVDMAVSFSSAASETLVPDRLSNPSLLLARFKKSFDAPLNTKAVSNAVTSIAATTSATIPLWVPIHFAALLCAIPISLCPCAVFSSEGSSGTPISRNNIIVFEIPVFVIRILLLFC